MYIIKEGLHLNAAQRFMFLAPIKLQCEKSTHRLPKEVGRGGEGRRVVGSGEGREDSKEEGEGRQRRGRKGGQEKRGEEERAGEGEEREEGRVEKGGGKESRGSKGKTCIQDGESLLSTHYCPTWWGPKSVSRR